MYLYKRITSPRRLVFSEYYIIHRERGECAREIPTADKVRYASR